jgi:hypothetical protein
VVVVAVVDTITTGIRSEQDIEHEWHAFQVESIEV